MGMPGSLTLQVSFKDSCNCKCLPSSKEPPENAHVVLRRGSLIVAEKSFFVDGSQKKRENLEAQETRRIVCEEVARRLLACGVSELDLPSLLPREAKLKVHDIGRLRALVEGAESCAPKDREERTPSPIEGLINPALFRKVNGLERSKLDQVVVYQGGELVPVEGRAFFFGKKRQKAAEAARIVCEEIQRVASVCGLGPGMSRPLHEGENALTVAKTREVEAWMRGVQLGAQARRRSTQESDSSRASPPERAGSIDLPDGLLKYPSPNDASST